MLGELSTLFKGFGKLAPGNIGKRTLDPTALRLALANLDPKRFAAGRPAMQRPQLHTFLRECPHPSCLSGASHLHTPKQVTVAVGKKAEDM